MKAAEAFGGAAPALVLTLLLVVSAPPAHARPATAGLDATAEAPTLRPLWELGAGVAAVRMPDYRGSDESSTYVLPVPYVVYRGKWLRADRDGARALLFESPRTKVDLSVAGAVPARSRDNAARRGMSDLAPTLELGPNLNQELWSAGDGRVRLDLRLPLRAALAVQRSPRGIGATFSPHLNIDVHDLAGGWNLGVLGGPVYADRKYHAYYYEVAAADVTPSRPAHEARGGYGGWRALASVSRRVGPMWMGAFVRHDDLRGAVFADSPLVRRHRNLSAGLAVSWVFATSAQLVRTAD